MDDEKHPLSDETPPPYAPPEPTAPSPYGPAYPPPGQAYGPAPMQYGQPPQQYGPMGGQPGPSYGLSQAPYSSAGYPSSQPQAGPPQPTAAMAGTSTQATVLMTAPSMSVPDAIQESRRFDNRNCCKHALLGIAVAAGVVFCFFLVESMLTYGLDPVQIGCNATDIDYP